MSDSESVDYLQPGFDPAALTNPRLRSILVTYNVHYPSNAKKPELVELFNAHVAPQAGKILARRARAKRSSMGIIDVTGPPASSQSTASFGDEGSQQLSPRKQRRAVRPSSSRATPHIDEQDEEDEDAAARRQDEEDAARRRQRRSSPRKPQRTSRASSYQPADTATATTHTASDTDTGPEPTPAKLRALPSALSRHVPPTPRRARTKTPQVKLEPTEEEERYQYQHQHQHHDLRLSSADEDKPFTADNPFQSGSSPLAGSSPAQRRTVSSSSRKQRVADGAARVVSSPAAQAAAQRRASPFVKAPSLSPEPEEDEEDEDEEAEEDDGYDPLEPGEEFTPEEQLELTQEEEAVRQSNARRGGRSSKAAAVAASSQRRRRGVLSALATPLWVLVLTLAGAYGAWYRQEQLAVGFCGLGRPAVPLLSDKLDWLLDRTPDWVPDWIPELAREAEVPPRLQVLVAPQCAPCPPHAFCYSDFSVRCESGYLVRAHPLALGGLVPLPPTCEPDGERARRVKAVADKAIEELRDRRAKWECGDLADDGDSDEVSSPAIEEPLLKEIISEKRSKKMSKEEFDDLWTAAIGDIESRDEVESEPEPNYAATDPGTVPNTRLSSTSLARLPLRCAVRRSLRLGLARYRFPLSVLALTVLAAAYGRARYRARRATLARVPALVDLVLERLAAQKELWLYDDEEVGQSGRLDADADADDSSFLPDPFLFLPQLRDDVLRATHSLAARERIWKHVRAVVEQNSNVRTGQREGRNGEVGRAWEWIGPVGTTTTATASGGGGAGAAGGSGGNLLEMSAARRRRSGRASLMASGSGGSRAGSAAPRDSLNVANIDDDSTTAGAADRGGGEGQSALHKRWQESRPIY